MATSKTTSPVSSKGRNYILRVSIDNHKFTDDWEKNAYKRDVESYAEMRMTENRPEDKDKSITLIRSEIYTNIYEHWKMLKSGYEFDFPITDLI